MSYCSRSCRRRFIVLDFKSWAYSRIYGHFQQHICTAHAQKQLFMNFRCKFRHRRSIRRPWFPIRVKISAIWRRFLLIFAFYMLNVRHISTWPTDLESIPHASTPTLIISTKFEVDMTIHCRVIAFVFADTSRDFVTLTYDLFTFNSSHAWRVTWSTLPPSVKTLCLSVLELRVITVPIDYHWKCVRGHCACAESRDPRVAGQKQLHLWNPRPRFAYILCN